MTKKKNARKKHGAFDAIALLVTLVLPIDISSVQVLEYQYIPIEV